MRSLPLPLVGEGWGEGVKGECARTVATPSSQPSPPWGRRSTTVAESLELHRNIGQAHFLVRSRLAHQLPAGMPQARSRGPTIVGMQGTASRHGLRFHCSFTGMSDKRRFWRDATLPTSCSHVCREPPSRGPACGDASKASRHGVWAFTAPSPESRTDAVSGEKQLCQPTARTRHQYRPPAYAAWSPESASCATRRRNVQWPRVRIV